MLHDGSDGHEGWLYHFADGVAVTEDGTPVDLQPAEAPTGQNPNPNQSPSPNPSPSPNRSRSRSRNPSQNRSQSPNPNRSQSQNPNQNPNPSPNPTATAIPAPEAAVDDGADVPSFVEYSPTNVLLYVLGGIFVIAAVLGVLRVFSAVDGGASNDWVSAIAFGAIAVAALGVMAAWEPTVVSVREGVLEVSRGSRSQEADLRDPAVQAETSGAPSSPGWKVLVRRPNEKPIVVRGSQVRRRQFARIVEFHQAHPQPPGGAAATSRTTGATELLGHADVVPGAPERHLSHPGHMCMLKGAPPPHGRRGTTRRGGRGWGGGSRPPGRRRRGGRSAPRIEPASR